MPTTKTRDAHGKYDHGIDRMCVCGKTKGEHDAARPHPMGDDSCERFRAAKETCGKIVCSYCERTRRVNTDGTVRKHGTCPGSGTDQVGHHVAPTYTAPAISPTREQIVALRLDPTTTQHERALCSVALADFGSIPRQMTHRARARIAEILNARAQETKSQETK